MTHPENEPQPGQAEPQPGQAEPLMGTVAAQLAANSNLKRTGSGNIDVLASLGGFRGLVETLAPGMVFLAVFIFARELNPALIASVGVGVILLVIRLLTKRNVTPAVSGLVGVIICAIFARVGGEARDYYVPGFFINIAYILAFAISAFIKWPVMGLLFGFIRGENVEWRKDKARLRIYTAATWLLIGVLSLRLAVQVPLYFADAVTALGTARLVMGTPLYIGALALAWMMTRPRAQPQDQATGPTAGPATDPATDSAPGPAA